MRLDTSQGRINKATGSGTGQGLAVVHGILREHDAALRVQSSPDQGNTFTVWLPGMAATERVPEPAWEGAAVVSSRHPKPPAGHTFFT